MSNQSPKKLPTLRDSKSPEQLDIFQREVRELFRRQELDNQEVTQNITNIYGGVGTVTSVTGVAPIVVTPTTGDVVVSADLSGYVPITRAVNTIAPLAGGGDLSADRTLSITANGITDALIRQGSATSVIGRAAGSTGNVADIAATANGQILARVSGSLQWVVPSSVSVPTGSGTLNTVAKWTPSGTQLGDSSITDTGSAVTVNNPTTIHAGTPTGLGTLASGTVLSLEQANGASNRFAFRSQGYKSIDFYNTSTSPSCFIAADYVPNLLLAGTLNSARMAITGAGAILLGDTAYTAVDANNDTLNLRNTSQHTANVASVSVDLAGQTDGDMKSAVTRSTYGVNINNPTAPWVTGTPSESDPGVLNNFGLAATVSSGIRGINYGVYADATGNTTNYSFYGAHGDLYNEDDAAFGNNVTVNGALITPEVQTGWVHAALANQDLKLGSTFASVITEKDLYVGGSTAFSGPYGAMNLTVSGDATIKGPNGVTVSALAGAQPQYVLAQAGQATWYIYEPGSTNDLKFYGSAVGGSGATVGYFDGSTGNFRLTYDLVVDGNTTLGNTIGDSTTIHGGTTTVGTDANAGATTSLLVKNPSNAASTKTDIALQDGVGDLFRVTADNAGSTTSLKAVDRNTVLSFWTGVAGGAEALNINASQLATFKGSVVVGDNSGTDSLTIKQGAAPTGLGTLLSGTPLVIEQANGIANRLAFRSTANKSIDFYNTSASPDGSISYDLVARWMLFTTGGTNRLGIDGSGTVHIGDDASGNTAVADNVDVMQVTNTGTGQTTGNKSVIFASNSGSYNTTAGALNVFGTRSEITATRSAGANSLNTYAFYAKASGAQANFSFYGEAGTLYNAGDGSFGANLSCSGSATFGDASGDTHFVNGNVTLQNPPTAGSIKYGAYQARILIKIQSFSAGGTYTPSTGCKAVRVKMVGGGGGGGGASATVGHVSAGAGGGSGVYWEKFIDANADVTGGTVTIGAAGTAGASTGGNGGTGGDTGIVIQGTTYTAKGGTGGTGGTQSGGLTQVAPGSPQSGSSAGDIIAGSPGIAGLVMTDGTTAKCGGNGGSNPMGIGGTGMRTTQAPQGYGAGGYGAEAVSANVAGAAGTAGLVIIEEYA